MSREEQNTSSSGNDDFWRNKNKIQTIPKEELAGIVEKVCKLELTQ